MRKVVQVSENQIVYSSRDGEIKLEPDKFYKVTKGNTDRSVLAGDVIFIDGKDGALVVPAAKGWLGKDEQTQSVMDFECIRI